MGAFAEVSERAKQISPMPQSLAALHVHLIFSTKDRAPALIEDVRSALHGFLAGVLQEIGCHPIIINSMEDHVHLLFDLGRTVAISQVVEAVKTGSSKWLKTRNPRLARFAWQSGYGAFAVSESSLGEVRDYISRQAEHHRARSFQDEFRAFLGRHRVAFDERYVWD
jgi:REP element-mobilizing transposase RayT